MAAFLERVQAGGRIWFGPSRWQGKPAFRLSVSSWRTTDDDVEAAIDEVRRCRGIPPLAPAPSPRT